MTPFNAVPVDLVERVADLDEHIHAARRLRWNASQMRDAAGFGRVDRILEALYAERDGLTAAHPGLDHAARALGARRRGRRAA